MLSSVPVNLIRQWCYCPRIVYYIELTDCAVVYPQWVRQGERFHADQARLWQRRNLSRFKLEEGALALEYPCRSEKYGIHGVVDMVIESEKSVHPVEFKLASSKQKKGAILQLIAYAMILQEDRNKECNYGFLAEGDKILHKIEVTDSLVVETVKKVEEIQKMIAKGVKPDSPASVYQCSNCEYLNDCNDRC